MKKSLLLSAALLAATGASAASMLDTPINVDGAPIQFVSPDGRYIGAQVYGTVVVIDLKTDEQLIFDGEADECQYGLGHFTSSFSNTGLAAGSITADDAAVLDIANKKWIQLATTVDGSYGAFSINEEGNTVVGYISNANINPASDDNTMVVPAMWTRGTDGKWSNPTMLPWPEKDFTGRAPQYVMAGYISADGNTIVGQVNDCLGSVVYPIVWTRDDKGGWTYKEYGLNLINPANEKFPEYPEPGKDFPAQPQPTDYMTADEIAQYNAAYEKYENEGGEWPVYTDYMNAENKAKYEAAVQAFDDAQTKLDQSRQPWYNAYYSMLENPNCILFNTNEYTFNGKAVAYTGTILDETMPDPFGMGAGERSIGVIIPLDGSDVTKISLEGKDFNLSTLAYDNTVVGYIQDDLYNFQGYVATPGKTTPEPILDWVKGINAELATWMEENMTHTFTTTDYVIGDNGEYEEKEVLHENYLITGQPNSTPGLNLMALYADNSWDMSDDADYYFSWILPLDLEKDGIEGVATDNSAMLGMTTQRGGIVRLQGDAKSLRVVDLQGRVVFETENPGSEVSTGVENGVFIVKAIAADGKETIRKAIF